MGEGNGEGEALKKLFAQTAGVFLVWLLASAHVGSPDTWFEGNAGPYHVTVQVVTAGVVPGVAKIYVRAIGDLPSSVSVQANKFDATGGAPPPEPAERVVGDNGLFAGKLWIMSGGSNSVTVNVSGPKGAGKAIVPVVVVAYTRLKLDKPMGAGLALMGIILFAGLVTIVGAAVRESVLPPGAQPTQSTRRRARAAMAMTTLVLGVAILGGWKWWNSEDDSYVKRMYKPMTMSAALDASSKSAITLAITDSSWIKRNDSTWLSHHGRSSFTPLVEDHGKLMHVFLIREDNGAFAHLHPTSSDSANFAVSVPPISPGRYRVFADIVHESGYAQTLVTKVDVPEQPASTATQTDPDDSWINGLAVPNARVMHHGDGVLVEWLNDGLPIVAGRPTSLRFVVRNPDGSNATLEPYMGMAGHAVVERDDGSVFVHLHPMGTISMASQMAFSMRQPGDTVKGQLGKRVSAAEMSDMQHATIPSNIVSFPYAFPTAGNYRMWVQAKRGGKIYTSPYTVVVGPAPEQK